MNKKQRTISVRLLAMSLFVLGILLSGCGVAKPPQEVVDTAKNAWKLFHAMRQDAVTNEELNAFEVTNWEKTKLPAPFDNLATLEGYSTEVYCLSFKPAISEPVINDMQNMLVLHKGENWIEAGGAWGSHEANWVGLLCGDNWENDPLCFHIRNSDPGQIYWLGASETMLKNAGCSIGQSK
jgi:hypothetical protein